MITNKQTTYVKLSDYGTASGKKRIKTAAPLLYVVGSLRNPEIPKFANELRGKGFRAFDEWYAAGERADDAWRDYEKQKGHSYAEALAADPASHVYNYDYYHINRSHGGVLVLPAGKSGHMESGFLIGQGKPVWLLLEDEKEPERFDVMTKFLYGVCTTKEQLYQELLKFNWPKLPILPSIKMEEALWLAGLFEGEGCFTISGATPRFAIQMTDEDVVMKASKIVEANCQKTTRKTKGGKTVWVCHKSGLPAVELVRILKPYLGRKRNARILEVVEQWLDKRRHHKSDAAYWNKVFKLGEQ